jgi:SH3 domain-binding protein 5 (SH3BP5)
MKRECLYEQCCETKAASEFILWDREPRKIEFRQVIQFWLTFVNRVQSLQTKICESKAQYAQSLRNLEEISESIHARRKYSKQSRLQQDCVDSVDSLTFDLGKEGHRPNMFLISYSVLITLNNLQFLAAGHYNVLFGSSLNVFPCSGATVQSI